MNGRLILCACLWTFLLSPLAGPASAAKFNKKLDFGDKAPDWSGLQGTDGKTHGLADYKQAKVLVIAFACNQCPVSQANEERFISLTKKYKKKGVRFVAINCSKHPADRLEKMKEYAKEQKFNFDYVIDPSQNVGKSYGATVTPHLFVLDKDRKIAYMGAFDDSTLDAKKVETAYVRDAVEALLAGKEVEIKESLQKGCSIVYEDPKTDEITLTSVDLKAYQAILKKHQGKAIVIDFWATWCVECRKNFPHTVEWKEKYGEKGLVVISCCIEFEPKDDKEKALVFLKKNKAAFPNLINSQDFEEAYEEFEIGEGGLPHYKVFDRKGKLVAKFSNEDVDKPLKLEDVEGAIEKVLADD